MGFSFRSKQGTFWILFGLVFPLVVGALWVLVSYYRRPMFYNDYVRHEMAFFPAWVPNLQWVDKRGNFLLADVRLNLILVVLLPDQSLGPDINEGLQKASPCLRKVWSSSTSSHVCVTLGLDKDVIIERCLDQLIIVLPNGDVLRAPFRQHQARPLSGLPPEDYEDCILDGVEKYLCQNEPAANEVVRQARQMLNDWLKGRHGLPVSEPAARIHDTTGYPSRHSSSFGQG